MQQVNPTGLRVGITGWQASRHEKIHPEVTWRANELARRALARRGMFLINSHSYNYRGRIVHTLVFYRYLQRSRLERWLAQSIRLRKGQLAPWPSRYRILRKLDIYNYRAVANRKRLMKKLFPAPILPYPKRKRVPHPIWRSMSEVMRKKYNARHEKKVALAKASRERLLGESDRQYNKRMALSRRLRGWLDIESQRYATHRTSGSESTVRRLRQAYDKLYGGRSDVIRYNVLQRMPTVNPLIACRYYIFKRYSRRLYQADAIQAVYLAIHLNFARLLVHTIVLGLERHAGKRKQVQFRNMMKAILARRVTWEVIRPKKTLLRISVFGKLDARMRRAHVQMNVGDVRYQGLDFMTSYHQQVSKTKFGSSNVRIWLRNVAETKIS
jgi:hypothetical protein